MINAMKLSELVAPLQGVLINEGHREAEFSRVVTDSRKAGKGDLFVALKGERFDGHDFSQQVSEQSVEALLVSQDVSVSQPQLKVANTEKALGQLSALNRQQFTGKVVGITGSAGKTTTKEMAATILEQKGQVLATKGNFNNEIGMPLTLLDIDSSHDYAVIEMGAAKAGDIAYLVNFSQPDVALVTNAMAAHIEGFGSVDVVAKTKGEIYQGLTEGGVAVLNKDDAYFELWQQQNSQTQQLTFSVQDASADLYAKDIHCQSPELTQFTLCYLNQEQKVQLNIGGSHNVRNALGACAMAAALDFSIEEMSAGLSIFVPASGRMQVLAGINNTQVIDDTYNANPDAVKAAIDLLVSQKNSRQILVLGQMAELGKEAEKFHQEVAEYAGNQGIDCLYCVGDFTTQMITAFLNTSEKGRAYAYTAKADLLADLLNSTCPEDLILVKGSRSAGMETIVQGLLFTEKGGSK